MKNYIFGVLAAMGSFIAQTLGGWDAALQTLVIFMAVDFVTGLLVAGVFKKSKKSEAGGLESGASFKGLIRKMLILLAVLVAVQLDKILHTGTVTRIAVILFFCANEGLSIVENMGLMGVPWPTFVVNALEALRKKTDNPDIKVPDKIEPEGDETVGN